MKKEKWYAIIIVLAAIIVTVTMVKLGKKKPKSRPNIVVPIVRVEKVYPKTIQAEIMGNTVIEANQSLSLTPEINGRISWISPKLRNGGTVAKGEVLVKLDDRDAVLAVKQFKVNVESAKLNLDQESARGEIAKQEWQTLGNGAEASNMVLRRPQSRIAELNLLSVESALEKAQLNLSRTKVRAPFSANISTSNASVGQVVSPQVPLCRLLENGPMKAEVTLALDQLNWIDIPDINGVKKGSEVIITQEVGSELQVKRTGEISALIGEIDQQTRRARLNIKIPFQKSGELPLLPGAFVEVKIMGKSVSNTFKIPREAITRGVYAWRVADDSSLVKFSFNRLWGTESDVIVKIEDTKAINLAFNLPQAPVNGLKVYPITISGAKNE